ncbi:hypothetical protein ERW51_02900 [Aliivibrio finisterrensis]|uniref:YadA C-terminal domain-containing protein n=1 Tax=Aliivibrio finisterrensis TaxID=511998 RepID=UPI00101EC9D6|nr:YadA C-terminal domain-containing protein [Aliivibrio finisterrensis]RYU70477.1 hypothetical protein ERW54_02905 [Aliivibrio finisterrensis]RYU74339.1 hypothetical protein ERW51_02900 [Aliivibrio finisterrensis]RYU76944.1 hypothetical protein ERW48_02915 [Aliivibrio finisterrensis]
MKMNILLQTVSISLLLSSTVFADVNSNVDNTSKSISTLYEISLDLAKKSSHVAAELENQVIPKVERNTVSINANSQRITTMSYDSNINKQEIGQVSSRVTTNKASIINNKFAIEETKKRVEKTDANLAKTSDEVSKNKQAITNNSNHINQNTKSIEKNKSDIKELRSNFEDMSDKLDGSMAQAGAMSQLVMPYGTGNFNITAAAGHSGHADALAIGSGYRYNEHITVRAGGAYDTGSEHVTVAAGVGYEF